jgi:tetratricopeptide (TPR) repeat protein
MLLQDRGEFIEAEALFREALDISRNALPPGHPDIGLRLNNLSVVLFHQARLNEAETYAREALQIRREALGPRHPQVAQSIGNLVRLLHRMGNFGEGEALAEELRTLVNTGQFDPKKAALYSSLRGPCLVGLGRHSDAEEPLRFAYAQLKATGQQDHPQFTLVLESLVEVADVRGISADAARWRAELAALKSATRPATGATTRPTRAPG